MKDSEDIEIGDLVALKADKGLKVGVGIIMDRVKLEPEHSKLLETFSKEDLETILYDLPELLNKPMYLVLWSRKKDPLFTSSKTPSAIWMFDSELRIVNKAKKRNQKE